MEQPTLSVEEALAELERIAPRVPLLALGQTVFWDEPMKVGIAQIAKGLGYERPFVAGVHDTDYFAKFPTSKHQPGRFKALPHNDTTTKGLWSAAGEFSALFGSETVITKETLQQAGLRVALLERVRPGFLDRATEAWGWKGVASLDERAPITAQVPFRQVWPELKSTFDWAVNGSLDFLFGHYREDGEMKVDELNSFLCDAREGGECAKLSDCYECILPKLATLSSGTETEIQTTRTTKLLRFNSETCHLPRFELVSLFLSCKTREIAKQAYNSAVEGSGIFGLNRFGTGAIPFDLVVPGLGRGTIRLGTRGAVIETAKPLFLSFKKPLESIEELAAAIEAKFGPDCALVGKAVSLIGMLAREFVFCFHEGASSYVTRSRKMHEALERQGCKLAVHPILRVRYSAWDALKASITWLELPEPLRQPFGAHHIWAPSFAKRWRSVGEAQEQLLAKLGELRRPVDLIRFLDVKIGGAWNKLAEEYDEVHAKLAELEKVLEAMGKQRVVLYGKIRELKAARVRAEIEKGEHFRAKIFEKEPSEADLAERERLSQTVEGFIHEKARVRRELREMFRKEAELVGSDEIKKIHMRRQALELEAELTRLRLIREAVIASKGLLRASYRPSAWWFPLVSPEGNWFKETISSARCYLEPLR